MAGPISGTAEVRAGPVDAPVELGPGDYADFAADSPHLYRRLTGTVAATLVITAPTAS